MFITPTFSTSIGFWEKMIFLGNFGQFWTHSVIHGWKAWELRNVLLQGQNFLGLTFGIQNFVNTLAVESPVKPRPCHKKKVHSNHLSSLFIISKYRFLVHGLIPRLFIVAMENRLTGHSLSVQEKEMGKWERRTLLLFLHSTSIKWLPLY